LQAAKEPVPVASWPAAYDRSWSLVSSFVGGVEPSCRWPSKGWATASLFDYRAGFSGLRLCEHANLTEIDKNMLKIAIACCVPLALTSLGCASIQHFDANPAKVCRGESVTLSWDATVKGSITATPPNESPGSVMAQGTSVVTPSVTGNYELEVSTLVASAKRDVKVEVLDGKAAPVGQAANDASASCVGKISMVTAKASPDLAGAKVAIVSSAKDEKHTYHVEHDGKSADIAPGATVQTFKGSPADGEWTLSLTLLDGEKCGTATAPSKLGIEVITSCGE
jgi:hypothetical protein